MIDIVDIKFQRLALTFSYAFVRVDALPSK